MTRPLTLEEFADIEKHYRLGRFMRHDMDNILETARMLYAVKEAAEIALPMAKGWAAEHEVGSNQKYASNLEEALRPFTERGETMEDGK